MRLETWIWISMRSSGDRRESLASAAIAEIEKPDAQIATMRMRTACLQTEFICSPELLLTTCYIQIQCLPNATVRRQADNGNSGLRVLPFLERGDELTELATLLFD